MVIEPNSKAVSIQYSLQILSLQVPTFQHCSLVRNISLRLS